MGFSYTSDQRERPEGFCHFRIKTIRTVLNVLRSALRFHLRNVDVLVVPWFINDV